MKKYEDLAKFIIENVGGKRKCYFFNTLHYTSSFQA